MPGIPTSGALMRGDRTSAARFFWFAEDDHPRGPLQIANKRLIFEFIRQENVSNDRFTFTFGYRLTAVSCKNYASSPS